MNKISITIDVSQVTKEKIIPRAFTNKEGHEVVAKDYKLDIIPLREEKVLWEGEDTIMVKCGFVAEAPNEEEKRAQTKTKIIGSAIEFRKKSQESTLTEEDKNTLAAIKGQNTPKDVGDEIIDLF
jgi:hypothetical protein